MHKHDESPSFGEVAGEVATASVGLGILTMALFPLSLGGLLLFVIAPVVVLLAPLLLVALLGLLLAAPFIVVFRLISTRLGNRPDRGDRRRHAATGGAFTARTAAVPRRPEPGSRVL